MRLFFMVPTALYSGTEKFGEKWWKDSKYKVIYIVFKIYIQLKKRYAYSEKKGKDNRLVNSKNAWAIMDSER